MEIPKQLHKEIIEYCKLNSIKDVDKFIIKTLVSGFTIAKYGVQPVGKSKEEEVKIPVVIDDRLTSIQPKKNDKTKIKDDLYGEG